MFYIFLLYFIFDLIGNFLYKSFFGIDLLFIFILVIFIWIYRKTYFIVDILPKQLLNDIDLSEKYIIIKYLFYISYICLLLICTKFGYFVLEEINNFDLLKIIVWILAIIMPILFVLLGLIYIRYLKYNLKLWNFK